MKKVSRRKFLGGAVTAGTALSLKLPAAAAPSRTPAGATAAKAAPPWPIWDAREETALLEVLNSGYWGRNNGKRVKEFEEAFAAKMQARHCVATASGTAALSTALGALEIGPGDEVILPPYTFVATFNVITMNYALPVFVDTDPVTFQIDPARIPAAITANTRLLLPVHIGGYAADLDRIAAISRERSIPFVEDACQAWLGEWRGRPVGTRGIGGCFSFQASKNLTSGEGGAVITDDADFAARCAAYHSPSGARGVAMSGRGSNYRLTEFQAALLLAQMTRLDAQAKTRDERAKQLTAMLEKIPGITPARFAPGATRSAYHLYMARYDKRAFANLPRAKFLQALAQEGVSASGGYSPLNASAHVKALAGNPHYQRLYGKKRMAEWVDRNHCPENDRLCEEAFWFSQHVLLRPASDIARIAEAVANVQRRAGELARA